MMADLMIEQAGGQPFSWGGGSLTSTQELRTNYIKALQAADGGNIRPLLDFSRS